MATLLRAFMVIVFLLIAFVAGVVVTDSQNRARLEALDKQVDMLVEMQNADKDLYESSLAAVNASLEYHKRQQYFRGAYDFCGAFYDPAECMAVVRQAAATTDFYEHPSPGFDLNAGQRD